MRGEMKCETLVIVTAQKPSNLEDLLQDRVKHQTVPTPTPEPHSHPSSTPRHERGMDQRGPEDDLIYHDDLLWCRGVSILGQNAILLWHILMKR